MARYTVRNLAELPNEQKRSLADLEVKKRELQLFRFLDRYRISDAKIRKIGSARKALLASYGIETAADVDYVRVQSIQGFGGSLATNLVGWRDGLARRFVFNPSEPLNPQDVAALKLRLSQKRQNIEKKLRITATALKQASSNSLDQRRKLTQAAEQALRGLRQVQLDEKVATGPIYLASRIGPFVFAGLAAFVLSQSLPVATSASSRPEITNASEKSLPPPVTSLPVQLPQVRRPDAASTQKEPKTLNPIPSIPMPVYPPVLEGLATAVPPTIAPPLPPPELIASLPRSDENAPPPPTIESPSAATSLLDPLQASDAIQIQSRLISWGYLTGAADGKWGPKSKLALQEFRMRASLGGDATWDETTQRKLFSDAAAFNSAGTSAVNNLDFSGGWTPTQGECGGPSDPPPMTITAQGASTGGGVCQFNSIRNEGNGIWRVAAKCVVGSEAWPANIRLAVTNKGLNWTSEKGQQFYYRCRSTQ